MSELENIFKSFSTMKIPYPIQLAPPVDRFVIAKAERKLGYKLPVEYSLMLQLHNGYIVKTTDSVLMGELLIPHAVEDIAGTVEYIKYYLETAETDHQWNPSWLPIAMDFNKENALIIDRDDVGYSREHKLTHYNLIDGSTSVYSEALLKGLARMLSAVMTPPDVIPHVTRKPPKTQIRVANPMKPSMESRSDHPPLTTIKAVMDYHASTLTINRKWIKQLLTFINQYENKTDNHITFLGSNLLGLNRMTYLPEDESIWLDDLLDIQDMDELEDDFHDLPTVNPEFLVTGNVINMTFIYAAYRIMSSKHINDKERSMGVTAVLKFLNYKFIGSILYHFFPYPSQESIALSLYESLTRKSMLKQYQNWGGVIEARALDIWGKDSIHRQAIKTMKDDAAVLYAVQDIKVRLNKMIIKLTSEYRRLRDLDSRVSSQEAFVNIGDGLVLREYDNRTEALIRNMTGVVTDKYDFIREELVEQTLRLVPTADSRHLSSVLEYMSEHTGDRKGIVEDLITSTIIYMQSYRRLSKGSSGNIIELVIKMRNMFRTSQVNNKDIITVRETMGIIAEEALGNRSDRIISSTRIAALVYLTLRILSYNHYLNA